MLNKTNFRNRKIVYGTRIYKRQRIFQCANEHA